MSTKERPKVLKFPEVRSNPERSGAAQTKSNMSSRVAPEINISSDEEEVSASKRKQRRGAGVRARDCGGGN